MGPRARGRLSRPIGPDGKTLSVLDIAPGSAAAKAGFQIGDVLISIDGFEMAALTIDEGRGRFRSPGRHHVVVGRLGRPVALDLVMGRGAPTPAPSGP